VTASVPVDSSTGVFAFTISGLTANTVYYIRAAALSNGSLSYGAVQSFKTAAQ
jgi:hypothetical protein